MNPADIVVAAAVEWWAKAQWQGSFTREEWALIDAVEKYRDTQRVVRPIQD